MSLSRAAAVADAVLYEGYMLYPYRPSALKDRQASLFGVIRPRDDASAPEAWRVGCECLVLSATGSTVAGTLRALVPRGGTSGGPAADTFELAIPEVPISQVASRGLALSFSAGAGSERVDGVVRIGATAAADGVHRLSVHVENVSPFGAAARSGSRRLVSTQVLLRLAEARFVPPREPPASLAAANAACASDGLWPILLGGPDDHDVLLCSPIILDDHPEIAPESPADLFDATEIDELLTLRILTLSDTERREIEQGDERVRALLARVDATAPEDLARLHGALRRSAPTRRDDGVPAPGDPVRLRPRGRADIFDMALAGRLATVVALETDLEGRRYVVVTVDDDPGRDLGALGKPGHRFFFGLDEVEPAGGA